MQTLKRNQVSGPAQITPLSREVLVIRRLNMKKVPYAVRQMLADEQLEPGVNQAYMPWFEDGYVANDQPRSAELSKFVMDFTATKGKVFAVARTDTGDIVAEFEDVAAADHAVQNAKVQLAIDVSLADDDEENEEEDEDLEDA